MAEKKRPKRMTNAEKKERAKVKKKLQERGVLPPDKPKLNRKKSGKFSINPLSVPKFGIQWYKEGGILNGATIFGAMGNIRPVCLQKWSV